MTDAKPTPHALPHAPMHEWAVPRLRALLDEAAAAGYPRDAAVAVLSDVLLGPQFNTAPLPQEPVTPPVADAPTPLQDAMGTDLAADIGAGRLGVFMPPGYTAI